MYTDHVISTDEHARWLAGLVGDESRRVFVVLAPEDEVVGLVSVTAIDRTHLRADWAFYLAPEARGAAVSFFAFSLFLGQAVGVFAYGWLGEHAGYAPGFAVTGVALLLLSLRFRARLIGLGRHPG